LLSVLINDLETPAFSLCPELGELRQRIETQTGRTVRMSGSGSTLFTLADDFEAAEALAARIRQGGLTVELSELCPNPPEI
jgi:4-diphosphocytidyl-2-C-methyl-D-erythritol kinase